MADDIVLINVPGPGDPSVVEIVGPGDGVVTVPSSSADLGPITARVGAVEIELDAHHVRLDTLEASDDEQDDRLLALEAASGIAVLGYAHEQVTPSSVWVIPHSLTFRPGGITVLDHVGIPHYPIVTYPTAGTVQLAFTTDVRGTARLS